MRPFKSSRTALTEANGPRPRRRRAQQLAAGSTWGRAQLPGATLVFVGDGPARGALEQRAGPGVVFAGSTDSVRPWLAAADVVVVASRWEGMSLTMLEAMACERCVVSTDVPGAREALTADAVVPRENPQALAESIIL